MAVRASRWLKTFEQFVDDIRISSKESVSQDERGVKLELWESQRRFMHELGRGLDDGIHAFNCLKSRQLGITTISLALVDVFWPAMHPNLIGCLVTDTEKNREVNRALIEKFSQEQRTGMADDVDGDPVFMGTSAFMLRRTMELNPGLTFRDIKDFRAEKSAA